MRRVLSPAAVHSHRPPVPLYCLREYMDKIAEGVFFASDWV
mgnify:CR=1 FL=1